MKFVNIVVKLIIIIKIMSERKINLNKILEDKNNLAFEEGYANYFTEAQRDIIFKAMEESIKQTLELAAENAKSKITSGDVMDFLEIDKQSILNTLNQIEYY